MRAARYARSRQKACQQCSGAKAKCDLQEKCCSRCAARGLSCVYPQSPSIHQDGHMNKSATRKHTQLVDQVHDWSDTGSPRSVVTQTTAIGSSTTAFDNDSLKGYPGPEVRVTDSLARETKDSGCTALELVCPINADEIGSRWLNPYVPVPGQKTKQYPQNIKALISRILKSYTSITVRGRGTPPFIHFSHATPPSARPPLSTCLTLARICDRRLPSTESVAVELLQREMDKLYEQYKTYSDSTLLSAFQAYLLYCMILFFKLNSSGFGTVQQAMMNLQEIACSCCRSGLVCVAEQQRTRPRWESWIAAEAKRRTLYTMYLFDGMVSTQAGLPTYFGTELQGLPAPTPGFLWKTESVQQWETAYNRYLADWTRGGLRIDELWPIPAELEQAEILARHQRVDQWLEDVDEFGTMLYAVSSSTHDVDE
ncbi:hypothetical protein JX265_005735 [Neoarthrinium moseri]|uniref:Zn(2)-C6 fungal-type domain-containing protein n=1 Tax=Neoarthrinium moseri TaxID=1658444 RepID=A0A9P9WN63_9PEZI|nr:uncharacterized protein JN550_013401 [Neoarthrinium moseri]KAI1842158.1 hypothetical protein JX266_011691 [Neoarthrinium moseri]KAI1857218.1 hypothetical protein JN550_013401 [Neoarthrinium moseri]KAI1871749.1 hypothetical protein JX265_005735 [Neoarthrinium moseri]